MEAQVETAAPPVWEPLLNPTQRQAYDSIARFVLTYGGRGSGKTVVGLHAMVRHCYDEENALALVIAPAKRTGKIGVIGDLEGVLDIWKNGNRDKDGNRVDTGMGLEYTEPYLDPNTKDTTIEITNIHGGRSTIILISIPYPSQVSRRMKAMSPSFVYFDEITETDGDEYFAGISQQLGRRKKYEIKGPQQFYASCNPEGPSHWVFDVYFVRCVDKDGTRDPKFNVFHIPIEENRHNLPDGYYEGQVLPTLKDDIDFRRLIKGEWVDRPSGDAIFKDYYSPELHVRPPLNSPQHLQGMGIVPHRGIPIILGYDPGPNNYCITIMQMVPHKDGAVTWLVIDELNFVGEHRPDFYVAKKLMEKLEFWEKFTANTCTFVHIADQSAFTHQRSDGNYDATRMRTLTNSKVVMRPFSSTHNTKGSVASRIGMVRALFANNSLFISATCTKMHDAMRLIASKKPRPGEYDDMAGLTPKRSPYLHPFDSMSYPIFYSQLYPQAFIVQTDSVEGEGDGAFRAGRG